MFGHSRFPRTEIDAGPSYEFLMTLSIVSDPDMAESYEVGTCWFDTVRRSAGSDLLDQVQRLSGGSDMVWAHLLSLAYEAPSRAVPAFLDHLEAADPVDLRLRLLGYYVRYFRRATPAEIIAAAAEGDPSAVDHFLRSSYPDDAGWQAALRALLPLSAEETHLRLLDLLRRWYEGVFKSQEPEILPILERDAESKRLLAHTASPEEVVEAATPGIELVPEPGIHRLILIPSYVLRPNTHRFEHHNLLFIVYPVADDSLVRDQDAPAPRLLRLAKALGDERRLRVLKRLSTGSYTLQELATAFGVGSTTMLHHMVILRSAGLVRLSGPAKRYSLRREGVAQLGPLLDAYLDSPDSRPSH